jgi:catechol 2,3-dioxygenase-like lactoylglutathione lyase family enzyme
MAFTLSSTVIGSPDPRRLAGFYERLLGWERVEDEPDWVVVRPEGRRPGLAFQLEESYVAPAWPPTEGRQQMMVHLDIGCDDFPAGVERALELGATEADHQPQDDVRVLLDPDGHPFCVFALQP